MILEKEEMIKTINPKDAKEKIDSKSAILVDVREDFEHKAENIDGAKLHPLSEISLSKIAHNNLPIILHCRSGKRSQDACKKILSEDPSIQIYSLDGGIEAWKNAGFSVNKSISIIPIERQAQIGAGILTLLGVLLGTFVNNIFYVIPAFTGSGLIFAGVTGWCGLGIFLSKMPWNK